MWMVRRRVFCTSCFFFQAKAGIRDLTVTGVQTCALPISIDGTKLLDAAVTYAKLQNFNYGDIIGRNTAGAGVSTGLSTSTYKSMLALTATDVGLGNVTNAAQVTSVTGTYPIVSTGGATPDISIAFGTSTDNTWAGTQTFQNPVSIGTLSGLVGANSGLTYSVSTSSLNIGGTAGNGTGIVAIANGGTNASSWTGNSLLYSNSDGSALAFAATSSLNIGGNAATATALETARTINGTSFNGTADITITAASSTLLANYNTFSGTNTFSNTITGSISGNAGTVTNGVYTTDTGTVTNTMLANSTISGIALGSNLAALTNDATLNGSSYDGSGAISDWGLNLGNANTWTALQTFGNASTTQFSAATETFYINSAGRIKAKDTT